MRESPAAVGSAAKSRLASLRASLLEELERGRWAQTALFAAMLAAAAYQLWATRGLSFYADEYIIIDSHLGFNVDSVLGPLNGNLAPLPILLYQGLIGLFGLDHYLPFRLLLVAFSLLDAWLLFVYLRRRVVPWLALAPAIVLLFFGGAWQDLATSLGLLWLISIAAGLLALLALDRRDLRGDALAAVLLVVSVASHTPGIAFAAGAAVLIVTDPAPRAWLRRSWIWLLPFALYVAWAIWAEHRFHENPADLSNLYLVPTTVVQGLSAVLAAIIGLYGQSDIGLYDLREDLATPIALALIAGVVWLFLRQRLRREALTGVAMALTLWCGIALVYSAARMPTDSRYLYPSAIFLFIAAAGALGHRVPTPRAWLVIWLVVVVGLVPNLMAFHNGAELVKANTRQVRAELGAVELARDSVNPGFTPDDATGQQLIGFLYLVFIHSGHYLQIVDEHGSPAYDLDELVAAPPGVRRTADITLARALGLTVAPASRPAGGARSPGCSPVAATGPELSVPPGGRLEVDPGSGTATVSVRRFGDAADYLVGVAAAGSPSAVSFPRDRAPQPWLVSVSAPQGGVACGSPRAG